MHISSRLRALLQAFLVSFLWSTSWVLIKLTLHEIPPLTFAGLRYTLAFLLLFPGLWKRRVEVRSLSAKDWRRLAALGLIFYALTQGGQFLTLNHLDAVTFSLLLNATSLLVALFGILVLREVPSFLQWGGILLFVTGVLIYFFPLSTAGIEVLGLALAGFTVCANAAAAVLGRSVNREKLASPLVVTTISMGIGAVVLLTAGLLTQGLPSISPLGWATVAWLAAVNTALAFTLWNRSLQQLSAVESSTINNTMLVQVALLAWLFLGEVLTLRDVAGLILAAAGILITQLKPSEMQPESRS
ncbi:MAG: DMT family transporter [Anaerolineales bacterium]